MFRLGYSSGTIRACTDTGRNGGSYAWSVHLSHYEWVYYHDHSSDWYYLKRINQCIWDEMSTSGHYSSRKIIDASPRSMFNLHIYIITSHVIVDLWSPLYIYIYISLLYILYFKFPCLNLFVLWIVLKIRKLMTYQWKLWLRIFPFLDDVYH